MWQLANQRTFARRWFFWRRIPPSTPVAAGKVVIMANEPGLTKSVMNERIEHIFAERGVSQQGNRVGWDFICRVGDPTSVTDLLRVSAMSATAVVTMMTAEDKRQDQESSGAVINGATIRTLLALRSLLARNPTTTTSTPL
jgi:hypothetical protein